MAKDEAQAEVVRGILALLKGEPKRGTWIKKPYLLGTSWFCNLCGSNYGMPHEIFNYCPNCGARMEETP